ncbi:hypothetical protein NQ317_007308 [Molorchus minor]|uniref:CUB domain-containing protein n=1 Tax=Molorchus minor TaxID=1323400 RepID=A0ABQ9J8B0_9CUCU|nr:hypothetical protein NQ317_007308 [Molorchus minor]
MIATFMGKEVTLVSRESTFPASRESELMLEFISDWFPGWDQHGHYNKQPNDDGLSEQDCVEVRRAYSLPNSSSRLASHFMWNDRDCSTPNYFICERLKSDESLDNSWATDCNRSVTLSREQPKTTISSPGFPRHYPDNANCDIEINTSPGYRIILEFAGTCIRKRTFVST